MADVRYIVRKENFGGLMYDRIADAYIPIDKNFFSVLENIFETRDCSTLESKFVDFFKREEILKNKIANYTILKNNAIGDNLSSPVRIHYCYTYACNMNCKHCFTKLQKQSSDELTFEEKVNMLDQLEELGISEILVGGGEPLVKSDVLMFIDECNKRKINVKLFTNGLLLEENFIIELCKRDIKYISISIDGTTEDEYEETRGIRALEKVIKNIQTTKKYCSFPVAMSVTVNGNNYKNAAGYLKIAKKANVDRIKVRPTKPSGNVLLYEGVYPTPQQYLEFMCDMQSIWNSDYKDQFKLDFSWGDTRIKYNPKSESMEVIDNPFPYQGYGCFAGKGSMVIRANGDVSPCGFLPENMQTYADDNIRNKSIKELWDNGIRFEKLRKISENSTCVNCQYYLVCRGGCIARILHAGRKINDIDPWCLKTFFPAKMKGR